MNKKNKIILSLIMFLNIGFVNAKNYDNDSLNFNPLGMVVNNSYLENESIIKSCSDFNINPIIEKKSESCGTGYNGNMQYERIKTAKISSGTK